MAQITLDREQTDRFFCMVNNQSNESGANNNDFWQSMYMSADISATLFNSWRSSYITWKTAYQANELYGTRPDGTTTFQIQGIGHFPTPPTK